MADHLPEALGLPLDECLLALEGPAVSMDPRMLRLLAALGSAEDTAAATPAHPCPVRGCAAMLTSQRGLYRHLREHRDAGPDAQLALDARCQRAAAPGRDAAAAGGPGACASGDEDKTNSGGGGRSGGVYGDGAGCSSGGAGGGGGEQEGVDEARGPWRGGPLLTAADLVDAAAASSGGQEAAAAAAAAALMDEVSEGWLVGTPLAALAAGLEQDFGKEAALEVLASVLACWPGGDLDGPAADEAAAEEIWGGGSDSDGDGGTAAAAAAASGGGGGRRLAEFYRASRLQPLYPGSKISLLQMAHLLLDFKQQDNLKDDFLDRFCRVMHDVVLPDNNIMTPSLHTLMKACEVPMPADVEQHVCVNDCVRFTPLQPSQYAAHRDECCPKCGERRFCERAGNLAPRKRFWHLGMRRAVQHQFRHPRFHELRGTGRGVPHDIYTSELARRIDAEVGGGFVQDRNNSLVELCCDAGQMFSFRQHSTTMLGVRYTDLPITMRCKRDFILPVVLIPGPQEPKNMAPYLEMLIEEINELGPAGPGIEISLPGAAPFIHRLVVSGIAADTPAQRKLSRWLAHNAYRGCGWCWLQSVRSPDGVNYWGGYTAPAPAGDYVAGAPPQQLDQPGNSCLTEAAQQQRARQVAAAGAAGSTAAAAAAQRLGCHGPSPLVEGLPCGSYDLFLLPVAHAALLGVVKDFLKLLFSANKRGQPSPWWRLPRRSRDIIASRAACVTCTDDFQRAYSCVINARGHWVMEDYFHFVETFSCKIFAPEDGYEVLCDPRMRTLWCHLRTAVLIILRPLDTTTYSSAEAAAGAAAGHLYAYGKLAEEHLGGEARLLCKFNLHQLVCRLEQQAKVRGHSANCTEYWVEVLVQIIKTATKYRSTSAPELVATQSILLKWQLSALAAQHPDHTRTFDHLCPSYRAAAMRGRNLDVVDGDTEQLLGSGRSPTPDERARLLAGIKKRLGDSTWPSLGAGWSAAWVPQQLEGTLIYQHADQGSGGYTFKSVSYARAISRVSYFSTVEYDAPCAAGGWETFVARIKFFAKVAPAAPEEAAVAEAEAGTRRGRLRSGRKRARGPTSGGGGDAAAAGASRSGASGAGGAGASAHVGQPPVLLRIAVCDMFKATTRNAWHAAGFYVADMGLPWATDVPLPLGKLGQKVVACFEARAAKARGNSAAFFPYSNLSNSVDL